MTGKEAYEEDVRHCPNYHDGGRRKTWEQLGTVEQLTWERNPTPRTTAEYALKDGYSRNKNPETRRFRAMTPAEALTQRGEMYFSDPTLTTFRRCRTNGAPKTWKTRDNVELPVKYGMYECARATSEGDRETGMMRLPSGGLLLVEVAS